MSAARPRLPCLKGLYLTTLSEPSLKLITCMQQFSFFDEPIARAKR